MATFEIHGDDENGITIRIDGREQTFDLISYYRRHEPIPLSVLGWKSNPIWPIELNLMPREPELDATPTVYGEGTWLH